MTRKNKKPPQDLPGLIMLIMFGLFVLIVAAGLSYMAARRPDFKRVAGHVPPYFANAAEAQPLPTTLEPSSFHELRIQRAYVIARQKPDILAQQPCYCGCEHEGHRSLLECFKNEHAAKCSVCIREAVYAGDLDARGKCPAEIRAGIIRGDWKSLESPPR